MVNILVFLFSIELCCVASVYVCVRVCYWIDFVKTKIEIIFQFILIVSVCVVGWACEISQMDVCACVVCWCDEINIAIRRLTVLAA